MKTDKVNIVINLMISVICAAFLAGCANSPAAKPEDTEQSVTEETEEEASSDNDGKVKNDSNKSKKKNKKDKSPDKKSLAQRMAGKYSYQNSDGQRCTMDVVPFGDNLYALCGLSATEGDDSFEEYSFWASEFIPYDPDELTSTDADTATVNELRFSVLSNAGMYWDAGKKGTITLTDDGLVLEGFDSEGDGDGSRLFARDESVDDAFGYLKHDPSGGDEKLQGIWMLDNKGADLYLEFAGSDLYIYKKDPSTEVFYAGGGCEYSDGAFDYMASCLGYGGEPFELSCEYKVSDDTLNLRLVSSDLSDVIPDNARYSRIKDGRVHVVCMDEVEFDSQSFGMFGGSNDIGDDLRSQEYYGVFVSSAKDKKKLDGVIEKLENAGLDESFTVFTPDFEGLNPEPFYVVTTGLYVSESDAKESLLDAKAAGFSDAYVKKAGSYIGDRFDYIMHDAEKIELLKDGVMLRNVALSIPYPADGNSVTADLFVPKDAVFDSAAITESFINYENGDSPYEWIIKNYDMMKEDTDQYLMNGPALSGVFEVSLSGNTVTAYHGSYWWD